MLFFWGAAATEQLFDSQCKLKRHEGKHQSLLNIRNDVWIKKITTQKKI